MRRRNLMEATAYCSKLGRRVDLKGIRSLREVAKLNPSLKDFRLKGYRK